MSFDAVLLDMGGVVLDLGHSRGLPHDRLDWRGREALVRKIRQQGGHADLDDLERLLFAPWRARYETRQELGREARWDEHLRRLRRRARIRTHTIPLLESWFRPFGEQLAPFEGVDAALAAIRHAGRRIALVSNVPLPGKLYRDVLARHGLARHFRSLYFSYDEGSRKPSPVMLRAALARLGVPPHRAVMVGDRRSHDVAAGRAAGTATVWLRSDDVAPGPHPDSIIDSLAELPALVA